MNACVLPCYSVDILDKHLVALTLHMMPWKLCSIGGLDNKSQRAAVKPLRGYLRKPNGNAAFSSISFINSSYFSVCSSAHSYLSLCCMEAWVKYHVSYELFTQTVLVALCPNFLTSAKQKILSFQTISSNTLCIWHQSISQLFFAGLSLFVMTDIKVVFFSPFCIFILLFFDLSRHLHPPPSTCEFSSSLYIAWHRITIL